MFFSPSQITTKAHVLPFVSPRLARYVTEHHKLYSMVRAHLNAQPTLSNVGKDPLVSQIAASLGFKAFDLVVTRVITSSESKFTVIAVPTRIWRNSSDRELLFQVKSEARKCHTRCLLVPQRWIRASNRESVVRAISQARHVKHSQAQVESVLLHLIDRGPSSIADCANLLEHADPYGAILSMEAAGHLRIEKTMRLSANSIVALNSTSA